MPDYSVEQELVQGGEGSLTFLERRFWIPPGCQQCIQNRCFGLPIEWV